MGCQKPIEVDSEGKFWPFYKKCFWEGNGNPLQYSCLENPIDRGAWWATVHGLIVGHDWLHTHTHTHTHTQEVFSHRSCCECSGWRRKGLCGWNQWWDEKPGLPTKQGELEGLEDASTNLLRKCTVDANLSILNLVVVKKRKMGERYSWTHWYYYASLTGTQKS